MPSEAFKAFSKADIFRIQKICVIVLMDIQKDEWIDGCLKFFFGWTIIYALTKDQRPRILSGPLPKKGAKGKQGDGIDEASGF